MRKRLFCVSIFCCLLVAGGAIAATPRTGRGGGTATETTVKKSANVSGNATGTVVRGGRGVVAKPGENSGTSGTVSARSAVRTGGTTASKSSKSAGTNSGAKVVSARAGTKQNVVNSGTKVSAATTNTVVSEECRTKYYGCMDSFCMLDNANGGRCLCSDRNAELDLVLAEIEKLDQQSYEMATSGVEQIEMGDDVNDVMAKVNSITSSMNKPDATENKRKSLSLQYGLIDNDMFDFDIFQEEEDDIANKTGDALRLAVSDMCVQSIPECSKDLSMLKMMYAQQIKSDCTAYENSLKAQKNSSAQKLATAQQALREAALEQYKNANEYDLGQCEIEFKKCMQTTAECKTDFTGCVGIAAAEKARNSSKVQEYTIKGTSSNIKISLATYDTLLAKKPICESVTKKCVKVKDQVWDTFLRDIAPTIKSAELSAESNLRMNCIADISNCFQKACKDTMDPNDPDGSYDMCLTRPETLLNLCKVQLEPCLQATGASMKDYNKSQLWDYVVARLASMRVDSCTTEVKECLQSEDRCGKDYSGCIGLDTDSIMRICPYEKMVGCTKDGVKEANEVYDEIATMVQGLMLNIDNNFLTQCQNALNESMVRVCGDTENCDALVLDENSGARSFKYQVCKYSKIDTETGKITWTDNCYDSLDGVPTDVLIPKIEKCSDNDSACKERVAKAQEQGWAGKLSGIIYWGGIYDTNTDSFISEQDYLKNIGSMTDDDEKVIHDQVFEQEIAPLSNAIEAAMNAIKADPIVQYCMTGRQVQGMRKSNTKSIDFGNKDNPRFPELTNQVRKMVALSVLQKARENYNKKYDEEISRMMQDQVKAAARVDQKTKEEVAENACAEWADSSSLPESEAPKKSQVGKWIAVGLIAAVGVVASIFT
ncbi:MAG: hypothetical protein ACLRFI_00205, partial [Alphaproteobacteria bacterium]